MGEIDKDLSEIIKTLAAMVRTGILKLKDGFQYTDLFAFVPVLSDIPVAIEGNENAWKYLKDMTEQKENDLVDAVAAELGDASENVRIIARRLIRFIAEAYLLFLAVRGMNTADLPALPAKQ